MTSGPTPAVAIAEHANFASGWSDAICAAPPWSPPSVSTLVVVPHPDDESLSTGGLIARLRTQGVPVTILAVTDGGAAYPEVVNADRLVAIRRVEQRRALSELGLAPRAICRLGVLDGRVRAAEDMLADVVVRLVTDRSIGHVVAPWTADHHADHEACGRAATAAARRSGVPISYGLFWALHRTARPSFGVGRLARLELTADEHAAKSRAIGCHRSQLTDDVSPIPMLSPSDLTPAHLAHELFVLDDLGSEPA